MADASANGASERGSGVLGLCFGVLGFLGFLLLATQIAMSLYANTVVSGAALDGGRIVARAAGADGVLAPGELTAARSAAERRVRDLLGEAARFDVTEIDLAADRITVTVQAPRPRLLLGGGTLGSATVTRRAELRLEVLQ